MKEVNEEIINMLNFLVKTYDGTTKLIVATKCRLQSVNPESDEEYNEIIKDLERAKGKQSREIGKYITYWDVWNEWMQKVPGVGNWLAGKLILLYYYRFTPVCPKCETRLEKKEETFFCDTCQKSVKGDGNLTHKIETKDFARVSSWWHYLGKHVENGSQPKRAKGQQVDWSTKGRTVAFHISESFNKQNGDHPYKEILLKQKGKHEKKNEDREKPWTKGHIHNAAKSEATKIFLAHFWEVARTLDGLPVTEPYIGMVGGHNIIKPFYWEKKKK